MAAGHEGVGRGKGVSAFPLGMRSGEGTVPLPRKFVICVLLLLK